MHAPLYDYTVATIHGLETSLASYAGSVMLIVNTATRCGFTPQLKDLETLYQTYRDRGFVVLGFPCNQFANQEPGTEKEIEQTCHIQYGVTFPLFAKIDVNGPNAHPLFQYLKKEAPGWLGADIKWNFTKFLITRDGRVYKRYAPMTSPKAIEKDIIKLL